MNIYEPVPPNSRIDQGDVFKDVYLPSLETETSAVCITPTCDLEQGKAHFIKFLSTVPLDYVIRIIADSVGVEDSAFGTDVMISKTKSDSLLRALRRNTLSDFLPRYYLLPEVAGVLAPSYLDLQRVFSIPTLQVEHEYVVNRVARIVSPWREQVVARYAAYSMRVGTPDYSTVDLTEVCASVGLKLFEE